MSEPTAARKLQILLVEDNPADVRLMLHGLRDSDIPHAFTVCSNSIQAVQYLYRKEPYTDSPRPDMIILDINLPIWNGLELLERIKAEPELSSIPVLLFSSSQAPEQVNKAYELQASCYLVKPMDLGEYMNIMNWIKAFWFRLVELPEPPRTAAGSS